MRGREGQPGGTIEGRRHGPHCSLLGASSPPATFASQALAQPPHAPV